jgi:hypothetical protein
MVGGSVYLPVPVKVGYRSYRKISGSSRSAGLKIRFGISKRMGDGVRSEG